MDDGVYHLNLLTWNIHGFVGLDFRRDAGRIARYLSKHSPDFVALQEVDLRRRLPGNPDIIGMLRGHVGEHGHEAWSLADVDGNYGQIILSKYIILDRKTHDISVSGCEPRKVMETVVETPGGIVRIFATHLGFRPYENRYQVDKLQAIIMESGEIPCLLMGDFNRWNLGLTANFVNRVSDRQFSCRTYPSIAPVFPHDNIISLWGMDIIELSADRSHWWLSDHLPVKARLAFSSN